MQAIASGLPGLPFTPLASVPTHRYPSKAQEWLHTLGRAWQDAHLSLFRPQFARVSRLVSHSHPRASTPSQSIIATSDGLGFSWSRVRPTEKVAYGIIAINTGVFMLWRALPDEVMRRHFTTSVGHMRSRRYYTLLTACFSHVSFLHLGVNMYALYSFTPALAQILSPNTFLGLYTGAGVAGTIASNAFHSLRGITMPSLGASGCIFGAITFILLAYPSINVDLLFFIRATSEQALWASLIINLAFMALPRLRIDGAGHMGGMAVGYALYHWMKKQHRYTA